MALTYEGAKAFFVEGFFGSSGRYAALHTGFPGIGNEVGWSGYSRASVTKDNVAINAADHATAPGRVLYNESFYFVVSSADGSETPTYIGVWKTSSGGVGSDLLSYHEISPAISAPSSANQRVRVPVGSLWWDFELNTAPLTRAGIARGMAGDGLVNSVAGILALFSDAAMTTKLSGNGYADISGIVGSSWNVTSEGVLRQGTARSWPAASGGAWADIAACGFMIGSDVMFGGAPTGSDPAPLADGGQFSLPANALTLTLGGLQSYPVIATFGGGAETMTAPVTLSVAGTTPTVTYSQTGNADSGTIEASFSSTVGITSYQWQIGNSGNWYSLGSIGTTTTLTLNSLWYLEWFGVTTSPFRISWVRAGVTEYGPEVVKS